MPFLPPDIKRDQHRDSATKSRSTEASDHVTLMPHKGLEFRTLGPTALWGYKSNPADGDIHISQRRAHEQPFYKDCHWYGTESRADQNGQIWERQLPPMIVDNFGDLVEVPA